MHPILFEIGSFQIPTYGLFLALAYYSAIMLGVFLGKKSGIPSSAVVDLGIYVLISAIVGAKLLYLLLDWRSYLENPGDILVTLRSGGVFYGGFIMAMVVGLWFIRKKGLPIWKLLDIGALCIPLGQAVGRWGCFSAGCCWGARAGTVHVFGWKVPGSIVFKDQAARELIGTPLHLPLYPAQIYLSISALCILAITASIYRKRSFEGQVFSWFLILVGAFRFVNEIFRGDPRGLFLGTQLSTSQGIAIFLVVLGVAMLVWRRRVFVSEPEDKDVPEVSENESEDVQNASEDTEDSLA